MKGKRKKEKGKRKRNDDESKAEIVAVPRGSARTLVSQRQTERQTKDSLMVDGPNCRLPFVRAMMEGDGTLSRHR